MRVEVGKYIVVDDEICHGKPTFKGTRVLVSDVIELLAAGLSIEEIIRDYYPSLNEDMIKEALGWAAKRARDPIPFRKVDVSKLGLRHVYRPELEIYESSMKSYGTEEQYSSTMLILEKRRTKTRNNRLTPTTHTAI